VLDWGFNERSGLAWVALLTGEMAGDEPHLCVH
jgi:hypothetical protein